MTLRVASPGTSGLVLQRRGGGGRSVAGIDDAKTIATPNHGVVADLFV